MGRLSTGPPFPFARLCSRNPIAALDKSGGLVGTSRCQPSFFSACGPQQDRAEPCCRETRDHREFLFDFAAELVNLLTHASIDFWEFFLHDPEPGGVGAAQLAHLPCKPLTDACIGIVLVPRLAPTVSLKTVNVCTLEQSRPEEALILS
jgi:hypothetical protein